MNDYGGLGIVLEEAENENNLSNLSQQLKQQIQQKHTSISSRQSSIVSLSKTISRKTSSASLTQTPASLTTDNERLPHPEIQSQQQELDNENDHDNEEEDEDDDDDDDERVTRGSRKNSASKITTEILLPPLPGALEDLITTTPVAVNSFTSNGCDDSVSTGSDNTSHESFNLGEFNQIYQHSKSTFSNSALNSPNLLLNQTNLHVFPSVSKNGINDFSTSSNGGTTNNVTTLPPPTTNTTTTSTGNEKTSPLKRLKNGIRKLSLTSITSSNNSSSCSTPTGAKFYANTTTTTTSPANPIPLRPILSTIQVVKPPQPLHSVSSSTSADSSFSSKFERARASSQGTTIFTPVTPPVTTSPVITIGEDLDCTKRTLSKIEQSYFDSLTSQTVNSIEELITVEDLLNYLQYLIQQRTALDDVFQKTKEKLQASGWCSNHDLNNLQLQQDSSRCQIDTSLLKIEERLNREFSCSVLGNNTPTNLSKSGSTTATHSKQNSITKSLAGDDSREPMVSPSLKVLESRCVSFTEF